MKQACWFIVTEPYREDEWPVEPYGDLSYCKGQLELGTGGLLHWQFVMYFKKKKTLMGAKEYVKDYSHLEMTRSAAAVEYVWKEETRMEGTQFEFGIKPLRLNTKVDWDSVWDNAKLGQIDSIPAGVRVRSFSTIKRIQEDYLKPVWRRDIEVYCYWGRSGTGKTQKAWDEAGDNVYIKDAHTKWWDGYMGEENIIIDDFTGNIGLGRLLQWFDKYPARVEKKGGCVNLYARKIWITSNLDPRRWFKDAEDEQVVALMRRMKVTHFDDFFALVAVP